MSFGIAFLALLIERFIGYPPFLLKRIGHPVMWMGAWLAWLEKRLNDPGKPLGRLRGLVAWFFFTGVVLAITLPLALFLRGLPWGFVLEALIATSLLAQKDLRRFVEAVATGLDRSLDEGRVAVSHIVGRDPKLLDESGVSRAALESLAENTSDGIVAPALFLALFGLPGLALYKAINTADSMVGHKSPRYLHFGWASARIDDLANLIPARLSGVIFALANPPRLRAALRSMWRDARKHVSPNAGWPEASLAGAMAIRLGGPRSYEGRHVDLAWMGEGHETLSAADIREGLAIYGRALWILTALTGAGAGAFWLT